MKQINVKLLAILFLSAIVTLAAAVGLYRFQKMRNSEGLLVRADKLMKEENFGEAAKLYSHYLRLRPDDPKPYIPLANALQERVKVASTDGSLNARMLQQAYGVIEEALRKNPEDVELRKSAVTFAMRFNRFSDAISHIDVLLNGDNPQKDEDGTLRVQRAQCLAQSGKDDDSMAALCDITGYDRVERVFVPGAASAPKNIDGYRMLAVLVNTRLRDTKSAQLIIDRMVQENPDSHQALLTRAQFATALGGLDTTEADILKALKLAPDEPVTILSAADYYLRDKQFEKAGAYYQECKKKFPDNVGAYRGLSSLALATQRNEDAIKFLNEGLERDENNSALLWARVNIELDRGEFDQVEKSKEELKKLNYPRAYLQFLDARVDLANGKWLVASKSFETVRPQIAQYQPAWLPGLDGAMALCYERMGQHDLRLKACDRIIDTNPRNLQARWGRVQALLAMGQLDKATTEYELVEADIRSSDFSANATIMRTLLQMELLQQDRLPEDQRNYSEAKELATDIYQKGMLKDPQTARVVESYFVAVGQPEKGKQLLDTVREAAPDDLSLFLDQVQKAATKDGIEKALQLLEDRGTRFSNTTAIRITKCELLARIRPDEAREELKALEADLDTIPATRRSATIRGIGRVYMLLREYKETSRLWERLALEQPDDVQIRLSMFELAMQNESEEEMKAAMETVESLVSKESAEWKWCEAARIAWRVRSQIGDVSELENAQGLLSEAIAQRDSWDALYRLQGEIHAMRNQPQAAIDALEKSLQLSVGHPNVYRSLARLYYAEGRLSPAERMLDQFPRSLWQQPEERMKMDMLVQRGKLPEKLPYDENSEDPSDHEWVGKLLTNAGRLEDAEAAFMLAKNLAPERLSIWSSLMRMYVVNKNMDKANALITESESNLDGKNVHIFKGEAYALLREWEQSLENFVKASEIDPEDVAVRRALADIYLKAGNVEKASDSLDKMLAGSKPHDPAAPGEVRWARRTKAEMLGSLGSYHDYTEALKLVEANGTKDGRLAPQDMIVWARLSLVRPDSHSREQAINKMAEAEDYRDLVDSERRLLADLYQRQDRWTECKSVMLDLLADDPKDMQLLDPWLSWLLNHDDEQQAARWVKNCPPNSVASIRTLAQLDVRQNRSKKAVERLANLIPKDLDPKDARRLLLVGTIFEQLAEHDERMFSPAEKTLRRYVEMRPDEQLALAGFLGRRGKSGDVEESIKICEEEIKKGNSQRGFQLAVGVLRRNREALADGGGEVEKQVRALFEAEQAKGRNPGTMIQRSEFEDLMGNPREAEKWLTEYMTVENVSPRQRSIVANNLAYMLALQGETQKSDEYIQIAVKILGPTADLRDTIGMVYYAKGEFTKAIREFEAAIGDGGATAFKYVHLAMAHFGAGNMTESGRAIKRAAKLDLDRRQMSKLEAEAFDTLIKKLKSGGVITDADLAPNEK